MTESTQIVSFIEAQPAFATLNCVQRNRITSPVSIKWVLLALRCMAYDKDKALAGLDNHATIPADYKPIYKAVLTHFFTLSAIVNQ